MSWLKKFPWLSLSLLILTYGVFGWLVTDSSIHWSSWFAQQEKAWGLSLQDEFINIAIHLFAILSIVLIAIVLTAPVAIMTGLFEYWLKSDVKAFLLMLGWSFTFVVLLRWIDYFARFLVLLCALILARLGLQAAGYNEWQTFVIVTFVSLSGFALGVLSHILGFGVLTHIL